MAIAGGGGGGGGGGGDGLMPGLWMERSRLEPSLVVTGKFNAQG